MAILATATACSVLLPPSAAGHEEDLPPFRTRILSVTPQGLPVNVRMVGDRIRFENEGSEALVLCGYETDGCEPWVQIGPRDVRVDRNSATWHANSDGERAGSVPAGAQDAPPRYVRVRSQPLAYAYHDHRVHWMGDHRLPPGVDTSDPAPQRVQDGVVEFRYGGVPGKVRARVEYVGGRTLLQRHGEASLTALAIAAMLAFFILDRRRRRGEAAPATAGSTTVGGG